MSSFPSSISPVANGDGGTAFWPSAPLLGVRLTRACNKQNEHKQKTNKVKGKKHLSNLITSQAGTLGSTHHAASIFFGATVTKE